MRLFIGVLTLLPLLAAAETAYVTDNLRLNMYQNADLSGTRIDTLVSGQAFEVLSRNAQTALVELPDGKQGYVSAAYMVFDKPARLIVTETQAENERLSNELDELRQSFAEPAALVERLRQGGAILICLLGGFLFGLWWVDRQSRKRHGGIRIY